MGILPTGTRDRNQGRRTVVLFVALAGGILLLWYGFRQPDQVPPKPVPPTPPTRSAEAPASSILRAGLPLPEPPSTLSETTDTDPQGARVLNLLLHTKPGQMTENEARALVSELIAMPDFSEFVQPLLASQDVTDRLLGVYLMMEGRGLTEGMRDVALSDPSPYVRAEVINWLFRKQNFTAADDLAAQGALNLSAPAMQELVYLVINTPQAPVPVGMHRLRVGMGITRYLTLLAGRSPDLTATLETSLLDTHEPLNGRSRLFEVLSIVRPPDYRTFLEDALAAEEVLGMRCQLTRHLSALTSATDTTMKNRLEAPFLDLPEAVRPQFEYHEQVAAQLEQLEKDLSDLCTTGVPETARLRTVITRYLETARLLGRDAISADTLIAVRDCEEKMAEQLPSDLSAEVAFNLRMILQDTPKPMP